MAENEIVLRKFRNKKTGEEFSLQTAFFEKEIKVPTLVNVPLYVDGVMISEKELSALGLEIVGYTQEQLDTAAYAELYAANPDLAPRVRQYRDYLDSLALPYDATTDQVDAALLAREDLDAAGRLELSSRIAAKLHDIEVNFEMMGIPGQTAWSAIPKLVKYLQVPAPEIPEAPEQPEPPEAPEAV